MDEDVSGRGTTPAGVPDAATIRRALGECMTLADIDDVMGWPDGTARRRRWRDPAAGGLPPADAELGGVPLWFRTTVSRWRAEAAEGPPDAGRPAGDDSTPPGRASAPARGAEHRSEAPPEPQARPGSRSESEPEHRSQSEFEAPSESEAPSDPQPEPEPQSEPEPKPQSEPEPQSESQAEADPQAGVEATQAPAPRSGFQLDEGQDVLAYVHGSWQPAVVRSRARRTVVVDYQVHPGALGARRQRVSIERIRQDR